MKNFFFLLFLTMGGSAFTQSIVQIHSQNLTDSSLHILFRGFDNELVVVPKFGNADEYGLRARNCSIRAMPTSGHFIVKPSSGQTVVIEVYPVKQNTKVAAIVEYRVMNLPAPQIVFFNGANSMIPTRNAVEIGVGYPEEVPLTNNITTRSWEISLGDQVFRGWGSQLTDDVTKRLKAARKGTQISVMLTCVAPDGIVRKLAGAWILN